MAGIIKASGRQRPASSVPATAFSFNDVGAKADSYLERVRTAAAQIVAEATAEADEIRQLAAQEGRDAAEQAASAIANERLEQQLESLMPALETAIASVLQSKDAWRKHWETAGVQLAVKIAERLLRREIDRSPQVTLDLIRESLQLAAGYGNIKLHLNPLDHQTLGGQAAQVAEQLAGLAPTDVISDADVTPGGCVVKTEFGQIDQRLESRLARIEEELT